MRDVNSTGAAIHLQNVGYRYGSGKSGVSVLDGLDFDVAAGGYVALMGASGAGKSTVLALIGGLERAQAGKLAVGDQDLCALRGDALAGYRRHTVGFVFQHFGLLEPLTALENVELAMSLDGVPAARRRRRASELIEAVGLAARAHHRPSALSGGERQRVAIARSLANEPRLILADEPTGNLDGEAARRVLDLLRSLRSERGCTVLLVTHNPLVALEAEVRFELRGGRVFAA